MNTDTPATASAPAPAPAPAPADDRWALVEVPRSLAFGDDPDDPGADPAFRPLLDRGWHLWSDPQANTHVTSPCGRAYLGFLPEPHAEDLGLWKLWARPDHHGPRTWIAAASDYAPYELITALARAWAANHDPDADPAPGTFPWLASRQGTTQLTTVLAAADWTCTSSRHPAGIQQWTSPDGCTTALIGAPEPGAALLAHQHSATYLHLHASPAGRGTSGWSFAATARTPAYLAIALATALTDPRPLLRPKCMLPPDVRDHLGLERATG